MFEHVISFTRQHCKRKCLLYLHILFPDYVSSASDLVYPILCSNAYFPIMHISFNSSSFVWFLVVFLVKTKNLLIWDATQVYQQSIAAACIQDWPRNRMLIQVLDDSDDLDVQLLIKAKVRKWQQKGVCILYRHQLIRTGYNAGNLKSAMSCDCKRL